MSLFFSYLRWSHLILVPSEALDYLGLVKLVNYVRSEVRNERQHVELAIDDASVFQDDRYLIPVLEDDALLYSLEDVLSPDNLSGQASEQLYPNGTTEEEPVARVLELEEQLRQLQQQFEEYRQTVDKALESRWNNNDGSSEEAAQQLRNYGNAEHEDTGYFQSYSYNGEAER